VLPERPNLGLVRTAALTRIWKLEEALEANRRSIV
jgi:hypothetical protein